MWFLEQGTYDILADAWSKLGGTFTAPQAALSQEILTRAGRTASIAIHGVLTPKRDWLAEIFGGGNTTYPDIQKALLQAQDDPSVDAVTLDIDSPGGTVAGMYDTVQVMRRMTKPVTARIGNMAASAAYGLASQADKIEASTKMSQAGSIGVMVSHYVNPAKINVNSTNAPDKNPDVTTPEGKAVITRGLDNMHEIFVGAIAEGRSKATGRLVTAETVNTSFGRGAVFLAGEALQNGMIDSIAGELPAPAKTMGEAKTEGHKMDLATLKRENPEAFEAAVAQGITQERNRVLAHLTFGENGAMEAALKNIKAGSDIDATTTAEYIVSMTAGTAIAEAIADGDSVPSVAAGAPAAEQLASTVESEVLARMGVSENA